MAQKKLGTETKKKPQGHQRKAKAGKTSPAKQEPKKKGVKGAGGIFVRFLRAVFR